MNVYPPRALPQAEANLSMFGTNLHAKSLSRASIFNFLFHILEIFKFLFRKGKMSELLTGKSANHYLCPLEVLNLWLECCCVLYICLANRVPFFPFSWTFIIFCYFVSFCLHFYQNLASHRLIPTLPLVKFTIDIMVGRGRKPNLEFISFTSYRRPC